MRESRLPDARILIVDDEASFADRACDVLSHRVCRISALMCRKTDLVGLREPLMVED
jgi:hypothetical protein